MSIAGFRHYRSEAMPEANLMPARNVSLTDALDELIEEEVRSGRYQDASEVVRAGPRLFEQRKQEDAARLRTLDHAIDVAIEQADRGEYVPVGDIDAFVDDGADRSRTGSARDGRVPYPASSALSR